MASDYKCKHCGMEFENKGEELAHYREFKTVPAPRKR